MFIVGTSGHIDHGKTSLIRAMTGIDCDRLPEEKKREMTIDIGFAQIEYPKFGTVSIIDVPGHEKFIRNMVVGAWGIDIALLVIAVDDGWMPQTEDHYRVLELLGVDRIIIVLNKIDLADEEMVEYVEEEVKERLENTRFKDVDVIKVSSKTGVGIDELKDIIKKNLKNLSKINNSNKPFLFVDRVFASRGYGTIITGTLKNGKFSEDETLYILPLKRETRVRRIESHHHTMSEGDPSQRIALNISGVSMVEIKRGHIVVRNNFFTETTDIIAGVKLLEKGKKIKNNLGIELLVGTSSIKGKIILINEQREDGFFFPLRIKLEKPWFFYPGESFIVTNPGGYRIIGGGSIILPQYSNLRDKHAVKKNIHILKKYDMEEIIEFIIRVKYTLKESTINSLLPDGEKGIAKLLSTILKNGSIIQIGDYLIDREYNEVITIGIIDAINNNVGLNLKEISDIINIDVEICKVLIPKIIKDYKIIERENRFFSGDSITVDTLDDDKKNTLLQLQKRGSNGIEFEKLEDESLKKKIKELIKLGFLISLDGNIVYHCDVYKNLSLKIMNILNDKDKISLIEAKESTNLSRKYIIPLLNRIEGDGLIKRVGDFRIKA